jgi:lysophospholipase L1-like esterase
MRRSLLLLAAVSLLAAPSNAADCTQTSTGRIPLNDLGANLYQGVPGGLYPGGVNSRPALHEAAGLAIAQSLVPLDTLGQPDPVNGRVVLISIGMSNATQEFRRFVLLSDADALRRSTTRVIDCAVGGQAANVIDDPAVPYWDSVATRLRGRGASPLQAQVAWIKEADAGPTGTFAVSSESLAVHLARIVRILKVKCPNLKLAYFTSRIYAGYATTTLNPEPYAYESGFAVREVIERQLAGDLDLNYDPNAGPVQSPWLAWGPYLWADGLTPRSDGLTWACSELQSDGTHPSPTGQLKIADSLLAFFRWDATTAPWYRIPGTLAAGPGVAKGVSLAASPNPSHDEMTFTVNAPAGERWRLSLHDAAGRLLMRGSGVADGAPRMVRWDGRDTRGAPAAPGVYWARLEAGSGTVMRQVLRLGGD